MVELFEHSDVCIASAEDGKTDISRYTQLTSKYFLNQEKKGVCFRIDNQGAKVLASANYYVGIDWIIPGERYIYVAPKINKESMSFFREIMKEAEPIDVDIPPSITNTKTFELDCLGILGQCMSHPEVSKELRDLIYVDWQAKEISIEQDQDLLTPLLVLQFLNLLKQIVKKGLKKSYYTVIENLNNRVKGKILVGQNIKQNVLKNRLTKVNCSYQEFGFDSLENRFLKKAMQFCLSYIDSHKPLFHDYPNIKQLINFCRPPFERISQKIDERLLKQIKPSAFFTEYTEAIRIGKLLLKRFSYSISKTSMEMVTTPPYWIDMPKLFELYAYCAIKKQFPEHGQVQYQFSTYGNKLDFLVCSDEAKMVVDAKYKLAYSKRVLHQDIRQVAGYARLKKVYNTLGTDPSQLIDCLIIYPDLENGKTLEEFNLFDKRAVKAYEGVFALGIKLPERTIGHKVVSQGILS